MIVKKVNYNPNTDTTTIDFVETQNEGADTITSRVKSKDTPSPAFRKALAALKPDVEKLCELPEGYVDHVRGLSVHHDADGDSFTVQYAATKKVTGSNAPVVINTPNAVAVSEKRVLTLIAQAQGFVAGHRAQAELELSEGKDGKAAAAGK